MPAPVVGTTTGYTQVGAVTPWAAFAHTVDAGSNRLLVVHVATRIQAVTSVSYGGVNLTAATSTNDSNGYFNAGATGQPVIGTFYMLAPPVGTANVVVTLGSTATGVARATNFTGVDQTTPVGTMEEGNDTTTPFTRALTSTVGDLALGAISAYASGEPVDNASHTAVGTALSYTTATDWLDVATQPGAASVTFSWTMASNNADQSAMQAITIKALAAALELTANTITLSNGGLLGGGGSSSSTGSRTLRRLRSRHYR